MRAFAMLRASLASKAWNRLTTSRLHIGPSTPFCHQHLSRNHPNTRSMRGEGSREGRKPNRLANEVGWRWQPAAPLTVCPQAAGRRHGTCRLCELAEHLAPHLTKTLTSSTTPFPIAGISLPAAARIQSS